VTVTYTSSSGKTTASMRTSLTDALRQFGEAAQGEPLRRAAGAGAKVLYDEMRVRVPVAEGTLQESIYRYWVKRPDNAERQTYYIGPNKKKAPHWHLIEYGHFRVNVVYRDASGDLIPTKRRLPAPVWVPPQPYIRPSFDAAVGEALDAMRAEFGRALQEVRA
jgi:HK97 gp10 family phage protein